MPTSELQTNSKKPYDLEEFRSGDSDMIDGAGYYVFPGTSDGYEATRISATIAELARVQKLLKFHGIDTEPKDYVCLGCKHNFTKSPGMCECMKYAFDKWNRGDM